MTGKNGNFGSGDSFCTRIAMALVMALPLSVAPAWAQQQAGEQPRSKRATDAPQKRTDAQKAVQSLRRETVDSSESRLDEMIRGLDPEILARLTGADVTVEIIGNQLILQGPEEAVAVLELLIRGLDAEREPKVLEIVTVTERDAKEIARTVQEAIRTALATPNMRPEDEVTLTALSSNVLLVAALPREIDWVIDVIQKVDAVPDPLGDIELMTFQIQHRKASDVATELKNIITSLREARGAGKEKDKLQIIPNNANNTITVTAREAERETIQKLINQIDVEPVKGFGEVKLTIFPLIHSKADEMAGVIEELLASESGGSGAVAEVIYRLSISKASPDGTITELSPIDLQKPMRIIADRGTNSLIVATVEENVAPMGELIRLLDGVPLGEEITVRLFPLRFAAADAIGEIIRGMFDEGKNLSQDPDGSGDDAVPEGETGEALVYNIGIADDPRTNTLIVSGRPEQLVLVADIVNQLDRPATALKFPLRFIQLEYSDASQLGQTITELFDQRFESAQSLGANGAALERERVFLSVDLRSNSLIVSASEENFAEIAHIAKQLDAKPGRLFDQIRLIRCERLAAASLKEKIEELWKRKADLRREANMLEDLPIVVADERSNSLIVASSMEDYEEIVRLVRTLEAQPLIDDMQLFKLDYADALVIADMLDELFDGIAGQSESFEAPTIIPDPRSNALVVAATRDTMERVEDAIARLDVEAGPLTAVFKVYSLVHASAGQLASRIQELFDSRGEGDQSTRTPVVVLADESSNSLIVSASRDDHIATVSLLELLDSPSTLSRHFRIFSLKMAKATNVAEKLDALFQSQTDGGSGRADAIAVEADERTNSIIVWAAPSQMTNIGVVITKLDTSTPAVEMMVKVIQLRQALAEDFATLLEDTFVGDDAGTDSERAIIVSFVQRTPDGGEVVRKLLRQDIRITPDARTNSLMVMAPVDSMAMLEAMIQDFDRIRPVTSEIRLFPLINSDADTMVDQLTELFQADGGGDGETQSQLVFGDAMGEMDLASIGQELRFASDSRTNTLIAVGAEVYLGMVEDLVRYLDSQEAEDRVVEVYQTKFVDATQLQQAIQGFIAQELDVLGEGDDEESRMRRMERQVSVEAIGDEDEGSSSLLVGTSRRAYQRTMAMIQGLDRPEPQVMISVLIAEVTLSDDIDLGVEIAGQNLRFSENAILGPNGIIQGSDFDFIAGTDLGAAGLGLGGFNFTITGEDFSFLFRALQADSRLEVLSRPVLMVRNGDEGKITIADQVPIVSGSQINITGSINATITREDVGIVLTATPHISPDGYVTIELKQEISNIGENIQLTEGVASPIFSTREVETNVTVRDGETVVIGGLIQTSTSSSVTKVPILGDIPILGALFRTTSSSMRKTELLVVLTVDILRTDEDVHRMSLEQRDIMGLSEAILQSPLMEGLRITADEAVLGPKPDATPERSSSTKPPVEAVDPRRKQYGPRTKTYGPLIRPSNTRATASLPVYGPMIARTTLAE